MIRTQIQLTEEQMRSPRPGAVDAVAGRTHRLTREHL